MQKANIQRACEHGDKGSAFRWLTFNWQRLTGSGKRECYCGKFLTYEILV